MRTICALPQIHGAVSTQAGTHLEAGSTQYKLHHALLLAPLEEGQVLLGLISAGAGQRHIIVVVHRWVLALVVHSFPAAHAASLGIHQRLIVLTALVIRAVSHHLGKASD